MTGLGDMARRVRSANFGTAPQVLGVQFLTPAQVARFDALTPRPTGLPAQILSEVAAAAGVTISGLCGPRRGDAALWTARHVAMALVRERCPHLSLTQIGRIFGGRDHSTVVNGIARGNEWLAQEDGA